KPDRPPMNSTNVRPSQATGTAWHQNTAAGTFRPGTLVRRSASGEGYQEHEHRPAQPPAPQPVRGEASASSTMGTRVGAATQPWVGFGGLVLSAVVFFALALGLGNTATSRGGEVPQDPGLG